MPRASSKKQPFLAHLYELRSRLLWYLLFLGLGTVIGYYYHELILKILIMPLNQPLYYSSPAGGFDFIVKTSLLFGFLFAIPVFIYHIIRFIQPMLSKTHSTFVLKSIFASSLLIIIGVMFAYFISLPAALNFLAGFGSNEVQSLISTNDYFSFVTRYLLGFGLLFQLPLLLWILNKITLLSIKLMIGYLKWVVLISFILAAIITPTPDVFNMTLMAFPIIALYLFSMVLIYLENSRKKSK